MKIRCILFGHKLTASAHVCGYIPVSRCTRCGWGLIAPEDLTKIEALIRQQEHVACMRISEAWPKENGEEIDKVQY